LFLENSLENDLPEAMNFYRPLGLAEIVADKRKINKILRLASFSPDFSYEKKMDKKGRIYFDRYKYLGSGFGVNVHGYRRLRTNKDGQQVEKHVVMDWGIFALGKEDNCVQNSFIDTDDAQLMYCFTEDSMSSNSFEFRINNLLELTDKYKDLDSQSDVEGFEQAIRSINMAMLMVSGTVLLPVEKSDDDDFLNMIDEQLRRELANLTKQGDQQAELALRQMSIERELELAGRLATEDVFSIFEGYFLNLAERSGIFSILADILDVDLLTNEATSEEIFRLSVMVADTKTTVYINKKDLVGEPSIGMRLTGTGLLQGVINF